MNSFPHFARSTHQTLLYFIPGEGETEGPGVVGPRVSAGPSQSHYGSVLDQHAYMLITTSMTRNNNAMEVGALSPSLHTQFTFYIPLA